MCVTERGVDFSMAVNTMNNRLGDGTQNLIANKSKRLSLLRAFKPAVVNALRELKNMFNVRCY